MEGLIDDEQGGFKEGRRCVGQIFTPKHISEKVREKICSVHMGFLDLGKEYDMVNKEALWQVLRMYDVGGSKLLGGVKSRYVNSSACVIVKGGEDERFRRDSRVRQGSIMSLCLFNMYMDGVMKEVKIGMGKRGDSWRMEESGDCLASCMKITLFCVVSWRRT